MDIEKYKGVTIQGSHFPDKPINVNAKILFNTELLKEYIPAIEKMNVSKGLKLLLIIMTDHEGYYKGTRSYRTNNPGNIGNTDSGANVRLASLEIGIQRQIDYFTKIIQGNSKTYPMNKMVTIKPFYSSEIAKNIKVYQMSPYVPGYKFIFTGQLDQFIKIYSTGARAGNSYLSEIISFFNNHGITVTPETTLHDINRIV
mgnify:CR=1 FL=1|tara:strand:- start:10535 stop:11134 length:600 start_codon:yes stop_codon:yes gene_type:complete